MIAGLELSLSQLSFALRNRAETPIFWAGALASDDAEDMEDEREAREESDTMDSGDEAVDTEVAREVRRTGKATCGEEVTGTCHLSRF